MTFTETAFEGHNQHSKSLNKQYRELTKYSQFENDIFRQDFLKIITNNWSRFLSTGHTIAPNSILYYKLLPEYSAGSIMEMAPSKYKDTHPNFASPSPLGEKGGWLGYITPFSVSNFTATAARFDHSTMNKDFEIVEKFTRIHIIYCILLQPYLPVKNLVS